MNLELKGKSVLVTGGSKGIGLACAILVNNAGDIPGGTIEAIDEAKWRHAWDPEQVADTVVFLASPRAGKLSGVVLNLGA